MSFKGKMWIEYPLYKVHKRMSKVSRFDIKCAFVDLVNQRLLVTDGIIGIVIPASVTWEIDAPTNLRWMKIPFQMFSKQSFVKDKACFVFDCSGDGQGFVTGVVRNHAGLVVTSMDLDANAGFDIDMVIKHLTWRDLLERYSTPDGVEDWKQSAVNPFTFGFDVDALSDITAVIGNQIAMRVQNYAPDSIIAIQPINDRNVMAFLMPLTSEKGKIRVQDEEHLAANARYLSSVKSAV